MAASDRLNSSKLALWVAADATTAPVVGDAVASVTGSSADLRRAMANATAAGDTWQYHTAGIPGGTFSVDLIMQGDSYALFSEFAAGSEHRMFLVPTTDDSNDVLDTVGILQSWRTTGRVDGNWAVTAVWQLTGAVTETHGP